MTKKGEGRSGRGAKSAEAGSGFRLGARSLKELDGVHPDLIRVVERALELSPVDFSVHDGIRTVAEQRRYVASGVSKTMDSKHLKQDGDGKGHAVDLVPYVNGKLRWEWGPIYGIAEAVRQAATELGVRIRWGGSWQVFTGTTVPVEELVELYVEKRRSQGRVPFRDGPHYELRM